MLSNWDIAFERGREAGWEGELASACPYRRFKRNGHRSAWPDRWMAGWEQGCHERAVMQGPPDEEWERFADWTEEQAAYAQ